MATQMHVGLHKPGDKETLKVNETQSCDRYFSLFGSVDEQKEREMMKTFYLGYGAACCCFQPPVAMGYVRQGGEERRRQ